MCYKNVFKLLCWSAATFVGTFAITDYCQASDSGHQHDLKQLKREGKVREKGDGYLKDSDGSNQPYVDETNNKRRRKYEEIARQKDISPDVVAQSFGESLSGKE